MMLISLLGAVSHFRFNKLIGQNDKQFITPKIRYFQDLNLLLSVVVFIFSFCLIILSADGLTTNKIINKNKFFADFFISNGKHKKLTNNVILIMHSEYHEYCCMGHRYFDYSSKKSNENSVSKPSSNSFFE
jgi:hypothetical protein